MNMNKVDVVVGTILMGVGLCIMPFGPELFVIGIGLLVLGLIVLIYGLIKLASTPPAHWGLPPLNQGQASGSATSSRYHSIEEHFSQLTPGPGPHFDLHSVKGKLDDGLNHVCKKHGFVIEGLISRGGMSEVYLGRDRFGYQLVLKRARGYKHEKEKDNPYSNSQKVCAKLMRKEGAFLQFVPKCPNIVNLYGFIDENNEVMLVEELIDGPTLSRYVRSRGFLTVNEALQAAAQMLDTLSYIHENTEYVYRDLQPHNLLVSRGRIVFVDFGGVARVGSTAQHLSMAGYHIKKNREDDDDATLVGEWLDTYSFANTLYFMLTGQNPPKKEEGEKNWIIMSRELKKKDVPEILIEGIHKARTLRMTTPIQFRRIIQALAHLEDAELCGICTNPLETGSKMCIYCEAFKCRNCNNWQSAKNKYCGKCGNMRCSSCGHTVPPDAQRCIFCGEPLKFGWE